ncbi:MAG: endo-1,4-beta-xylanase, partial [Patescibacteria group bacterium]
MHKALKILFAVMIVLLTALVIIFFGVKVPQAKNITLGVNFSQMQAVSLGLDWHANYTALLSDLGAKNIKLVTNWDFVEGKKDSFYFNDIDWQLAQAKKYNAKIVYVVGMKTGRWPECHVPGWASSISKQDQQDEILNYIVQVVNRYKNSSVITAWQAENEPFFNFGKCPWYDKNFLAKEVALIKALDPSRPVIVSDTGEQSLWFDAAKIGDIVGSTLYRKLWV